MSHPGTKSIKQWPAAICASGIIAIFALPVVAQPKRAITARDCVTVRTLQQDYTSRSNITISPDGRRIAYLVRSPNLETNANDSELYVRNLSTDEKDSGKPILVGDLSAMRWLHDSTHLVVLMREDGRRRIEEANSVTGDHSTFFGTDADIVEYSVDRQADTIVYATDTPTDVKEGPTPQEVASGYRIAYQTTADASWPKRKLFVVRHAGKGWTTPASIVIHSPMNQQALTELAHARNSDLEPTLSPDGNKLLLSYWDFSEEMPSEWRNSGYMKYRSSAGIIQAFHLLVLYDLATGKSFLTPLKTPWVISAPLWATDNQSFVVVAFAPINSDLEREQARTGVLGHSAGAHLFRVELSTGTTEDGGSKTANPWAGPLGWSREGDLLVQMSSLDTITRFSRLNGRWGESSSFRVPVRVGQVDTNGDYVVGDLSDTTTPPEVFIYHPGDTHVQVIAKLNPQFDDLTFGIPKVVHWSTSTGFNASGILLLPPNYKDGEKYPLVIQTKPFGEFFVCSFGNFPSFAPQPMANAGLMYLGQIATKGSTQKEQDFFPKGYPGYQGFGGIAEAAFAMDLWDSAVKELDRQGLVDSKRVGIIGFSRTGWYTEFILAHSTDIQYRAATVADNVQYSLGEYWLAHDASTMKSYELTYGGPPYGATLENWLNNSVSFNISKIRTPLLMEEMGYGSPYNNPHMPPTSLAASFEVFTGLNRLRNPVELFYYPDEDHTPEHPRARLSTMERNVDWYRFWLQDYENPNPNDTQEYDRWHKLRQLQLEEGTRASLVSPHTDPGSKNNQ